MILVDKKEIRVIHALLAKLGLANDADYKKRLLAQYSETGISSTKELDAAEAARLITDLQQVVNKRGANPDAIIKKRRLILHYAHQMGWEEAQGKVDMERVNRWCVHYGQFHKPLNAHSLTELSHLIVQMEKAYKDYLRSV